MRGVVGAHADRKDNDGDGFIDEPSDDWDNNLWPSGDFDGGRESDQSAPAYIGGGRDSDRDGTLDDANVSNSDMLHGGLIRIGDYKDGSVENLILNDFFSAHSMAIAHYIRDRGLPVEWLQMQN